MVDEISSARISEKIVREFQPERIILFGSYAYGTRVPIRTSISWSRSLLKAADSGSHWGF